MPRQARLDTSGILHYVMVRGIERRRIFREDEDREDFVSRLRMLSKEAATHQFRTFSGVRAKVAWELNRGYGIPMAEIARHVGVCTSAIANALGKVERE